MLRRTSVVLLELVAALTAGATILAGLAVWWLSTGPVRLGFLTPLIEQQLNPDDRSVEIRISDTVLTWAGWQRLVDIRATGVSVIDDHGTPIANLPEASIQLSAPALLRGIVAPERIDILRPKIDLERSADGKIAFGIADAGGGGGQQALLVLIADLLRPLDPTKSTGYLSRINIEGAQIALRDRQLGVNWVAPNADVLIDRDVGGIRARFGVDVAIDDNEGRIEGEMRYWVDGQEVEAAINVDNLRPSDFANSAEILQPLGHIRMPVSGLVDVRLTSGWRLARAEFQFVGENGQVVLPEVHDGPIDVAQLHLNGRLEDDGAKLEISNLYADLGGQVLRTSGQVTFDAEGAVAQISTSVRGINLEEALHYWPEGMATAQRDWVRQSVAGGEVLEARLAVRTRIPGTSLADLRIADATVEGFRADADFRDLAINHGDQQQPVTLALGTVRTDGKAIQVVFTDGTFPLSDDMPPVRLPGGVATFDREHQEVSIQDGILPLSDSMPPLTGIAGTARIADGQLEFDLAGAQMLFDDGYPRITNLAGKLRRTETGITLDYKDAKFILDKDFPPIEGINGTAVVAPDKIVIKGKSARLGKLALRDGTVTISDLDKAVPKTKIDMVAKGAVRDAVDVLRHPPFALTQALADKQDAVGGAFDMQIGMRFDIDDALTFERIEKTASAHIAGLSWPDGPMGLAIDDGALRLDYTRKDVKATGQVALVGQPFQLDWQRHQGAKTDKPRDTLTLRGIVDEPQRVALGLPSNGMIAGPTPLAMIYTSGEGDQAQIAANIDLTQNALNVPQLYWGKAAKVPGTARVVLRLEDGAPTEVTDFEIAAGDLTARGSMTLAPDSAQVAKVDLQTMTFGGEQGTDVTGTLTRRGDGGWDANLIGPRLNLQKYIEDPELLLDFPLQVTLRLDQLRVRDASSLYNVTGGAMFDGERWEHIDIQSKLAGGGDYSIQLSRRPYQVAAQGAKLANPAPVTGSGVRVVEVRSNDAGAALRTLGDFGVFQAVRGGHLTIFGYIDDTREDEPFLGALQIENFNVVNAPSIVRLVQALSVVELDDAFVGEGVRFDLLQARFEQTKDHMKLENMSARGPALGIHARGDMDLAGDTMDIRGAVAPIDWVNQILEKIPGLNVLFTGPDGNGVVAIAFSMQGPAASPAIRADPLTGVTPGIFRALFGVTPTEAGLPPRESTIKKPEEETDTR